MKTIAALLLVTAFGMAEEESIDILEQPVVCLEDGICIGIATELDLIERLGEPDEIVEAEFREATGEWMQKWVYGENALTLTLFSAAETGPWVVGNIEMEENCQLRTIHGVGIGSTIEEVAAAYKSDTDEEHTTEDFFVAGSIYNGVGIFFEDGVAVRIVLGPLTE